MVRLEVALSVRSYPVLIGPGALAELPALLGAHRHLAVVADAAFDPRSFKLPLPADSKIHWYSLRGGEAAKTLESLGRLLEFLEDSRIGRDGCLVALGGGSVGDLAGLAASIWQRGIDLFQVPTTLLAMVDSSIGGKTGINSARAKNAIGTFWQPQAVVIDPGLLAGLPEGEYRAAFGEVVKYAVAMDAELFRMLERDAQGLLERQTALLEAVVARCVAAKATVVVVDERDELGRREILNYGHTVAHGIESASGFRAPHGQAVAQGIRAAARIAAASGLCDAGLVGAQDSLLARFGLPGGMPAVQPETVLAALPRDKKARGGEIHWVLPREIGRAETGMRVSDAVAEAAVREVLA